MTETLKRLVDDLKNPLNEVKNVYVRRTVTVLLSPIVFVGCGAILGAECVCSWFTKNW